MSEIPNLQHQENLINTPDTTNEDNWVLLAIETNGDNPEWAVDCTYILYNTNDLDSTNVFLNKEDPQVNSTKIRLQISSEGNIFNNNFESYFDNIDLDGDNGFDDSIMIKNENGSNTFEIKLNDNFYYLITNPTTITITDKNENWNIDPNEVEILYPIVLKTLPTDIDKSN